jgi:hypothetical protein
MLSILRSAGFQADVHAGEFRVLAGAVGA